MKVYYKQLVQNISFENLEAFEEDPMIADMLSDRGFEAENTYSQDQVMFIMGGLTNRQREILNLVLAGYSRKEIAGDQGICLQAVHQIIPRIRKRVMAMPNVSTYIKNRIHDIA